MYVLTVANRKGGSGKTVTTTNLAVALRDAGRKVLVVDFDPQGDSGKTFDVYRGGDDATITDVLMGEVEVGDVIEPVGKNLGLLPSNDGLGDVTDHILGGAGTTKAALYDALSHAGDEGYNVAVIDTNPDENDRQLAALALADVILVPLNARDPLSAPNAVNLVEHAGEIAPDAAIRVMVTATAMPRRDGRFKPVVEGSVTADAKEHWGDLVLETTVVGKPEVAFGAMRGTPPVTIARPDGLPATQFRRIADHLLPLLTHQTED